MKIHFTANVKAIQTEYWLVEAPDNWEQLSEGERLRWLEDNINLAEFRSEQHNGVEERTVVDYHRS